MIKKYNQFKTENYGDFKKIFNTIKSYIDFTLDYEKQINNYIENIHIASTFKEVLKACEKESLYPEIYHNITVGGFDSVSDKSKFVRFNGKYYYKEKMKISFIDIIDDYFNLERLNIDGVSEIIRTYNKLREKKDIIRNNLILIDTRIPYDYNMKHNVNSDLKTDKIKIVKRRKKSIDTSNENKNNYITLYHGGYIDKLYSPLYLTDDYYMAKSYNENIYTFYIDGNSNILDLTVLNTFQEIKKKIYDNNSENYLKYKISTQFGLESTDRIQKNYNVLKQYNNYDSIVRSYKKLLSYDFVKNIWSNNHYERINDVSNFYKTASYEERQIINELEILEHEIRNMNTQDDYSLNMFGKYFQDYAKANNFIGYKAISTYLDGKTKAVEYCIIDIEELITTPIV